MMMIFVRDAIEKTFAGVMTCRKMIVFCYWLLVLVSCLFLALCSVCIYSFFKGDKNENLLTQGKKILNGLLALIVLSCPFAYGYTVILTKDFSSSLFDTPPKMVHIYIASPGEKFRAPIAVDSDVITATIQKHVPMFDWRKEYHIVILEEEDDSMLNKTCQEITTGRKILMYGVK
jgi:hypothetical protein